MAQITQGATYTKTFMMIQSTDHVSPLTLATVTVKIAKAGGTGAAPSGGGTATEMDSTNMPGWYKIAFSATDTNTLGDLSLHATAAGGDNTDLADQIVAAAAGGSVTVGGYAAGQDPLTLLNNNLILAAAGNTAVQAAVFAKLIESGMTFEQLCRLLGAAEGGVVAGAGTANITISGAGVGTTRVTAIVDSVGNRSSVSLNL